MAAVTADVAPAIPAAINATVATIRKVRYAMGDYRLSADQPKPRDRPSLRLEIERIGVDAALEARKQLQPAGAAGEAHAGLDPPPGLRPTVAGTVDAEHISVRLRKTLEPRGDGAADNEVKRASPK